MAGIKNLKDWKIRRISYVMLTFLILILLGSFSVMRYFGLSEEDLIKYEMAVATHYKINQLQPYHIVNLDHETIESLLSDINLGIHQLLIGGTIKKAEQTYTLPPAKNDYRSALEKIKEVWLNYHDNLQEQLEKTTNSDALSTKDLVNIFADLDKGNKKLIHATNQYLEAQKARQQWFMIAVFILSLAVFIFIYTIMRYFVLEPIYTISLTSRNLAKGNLSNKIPLNNRNEIGYIAQNINSLADILKHASDFTHEITKGNLDADYQGLDDIGTDETNSIAHSLLRMRDNMRDSAIADKQRSWVNEGLAKFADILRNNSDNQEQLSYETITELVKYMKTTHGAIYILNENEENEKVLQMTGAYAYGRQKRIKHESKIGEGLVGQCFLEKQRIYLTEIPKDYIHIKSGLGDTSPKALLIVPMMVNEEIAGILEIASLEEIPEYQIEFVERLAETIASTVSTVKTNEQTKQLLEESNQMTEQLRSAEEEMRQNMEEMEATQEEMKRAQKELEFKEANLNALINNTDDSIITIDTNYKVMILNRVLKERYKGTEFEGIDTGTNALDMLGSVRDEWKAYYDRALSGEKLEFIIKSSVKGEDSYRQYNLNPIKDQNGEIVGASIFSRDVTKLTAAERKAERVLHDLEQKNKIIDYTLLFAEINADKESILINDKMLSLLNYQKADVINKHFNRLLADEKYLKSGLEKMHEGEIHEEEVELKSKDGTLHKMKCCATAVFNKDEIEKYALVFY